MELLSKATLGRVGSMLLVLAAAALVAAAAAAGPHGEYAVKAEFLANFASLVEWPPEAFRNGDDLRVGILGDEAVVDEIRSRLNGRVVKSRVLRTRRVAPTDTLVGLHMVYVTASAQSHAEEVKAAVAGSSVLLVGESRGFARRGGAINFYDEASKIRFEVNPKAAQSAGLRVSSRLLSVAKVVE